MTFKQANKDMEIINQIMDLGILTQDEIQMLQSVKRHFAEYEIIKINNFKSIKIIQSNIRDVQILSQGDAQQAQDLQNEFNASVNYYNFIQNRIAPKDMLSQQLRNLKDECEKINNKQQDVELDLRRINNSIVEYETQLELVKVDVKKNKDSIHFKNSVHKHLKGNLNTKKQEINRLEQTAKEQRERMNIEGNDLKLEKQRRQRQLDQLASNHGRLKQQLIEGKERISEEKKKLDAQTNDWRERARAIVTKRNDGHEILLKSEKEVQLLRSQLQRHQSSNQMVLKRTTEISTQLKNVKSEIDDIKQQIEKIDTIPDSTIRISTQLKNEKLKLANEIDNYQKMIKEANIQIIKMKKEYSELVNTSAYEQRYHSERNYNQVIQALKQIKGAVSAAESSYTCFECLKYVKDPMTFTPCGHSICKHHDKHSDDMLICPECKNPADLVFNNPNISFLMAKLDYVRSLVSTAIEGV